MGAIATWGIAPRRKPDSPTGAYGVTALLYRWRVAGYQADSMADVSNVELLPTEEVATEVESAEDKSSSFRTGFLFFGRSKASGGFHHCWIS